MSVLRLSALYRFFHKSLTINPSVPIQCPSYRDVHFIEWPLYRGSTVYTTHTMIIDLYTTFRPLHLSEKYPFFRELWVTVWYVSGGDSIDLFTDATTIFVYIFLQCFVEWSGVNNFLLDEASVLNAKHKKLSIDGV